MNLPHTDRIVALAGYFFLFTLLLTWTAFIDPPQVLPRSLVLIVLLVPLLLPLRGLLHGRTRAHMWTSLLALVYFSLGVSNLAVAGDRVYGALQVAASLMLFVGSLLYVRRLNPRRKGSGAGKAA
ncbi:MAG: DUF2069 domain-containing protein [Chromatiales bacterium]|jgi:uncharacterized membrane protein|nr:DUF2069 domain-containing protein [Chromatiales bacterium]MDX9765842.1 DUF2069 domain-containing protein [Ectothiorhodospiraceae bacterium]